MVLRVASTYGLAGCFWGGEASQNVNWLKFQDQGQACVMIIQPYKRRTYISPLCPSVHRIVVLLTYFTLFVLCACCLVSLGW